MQQKGKRSSYRVLYWLGAGVALLLVGVLVLAKLAPQKQGGPPPDPERTVIWLYDLASPTTPGQVIILEESRSQQTMTLVALTAPADLQAVFGGAHGAKAQEQLGLQAGRKIHHRVFLPYSVVAILVDAAQGISVSGREFGGADAVGYIRNGGDMGPDRASRVMLALAEAVSRRGIDMSASEGFRLARQVETDIDLTVIPDVLTRWSRYTNPTVRSAPGLPQVHKLLMADRP